MHGRGSSKSLTLAALDKPPILRRDRDGRFMTTLEIERDDARILAAERTRPPSRPPVNRPNVFTAPGLLIDFSVEETDEEILARAPSTPPPIPARSPLRPPYVPPAATVQPVSSAGSSLFGPAGPDANSGFVQGNPWSLSGRLPPVVALVSPSLPPSAPSECFVGVEDEDEEEKKKKKEEEHDGPRGVEYTPDTTGLQSGFSSSSSSGASVVVSRGTVEVRGRRWGV
ncbi:hypothetical protein M436DRAFT_84980 [Aureobasidium namibiae CBS 147.97]|uniref:Uncharacterized protein n=1 Tax=Aureobasidium namibiae CBS 147.97 TaxID=1043004 RepID=A0A074WEF6_9PEZI